MIKKEQQQDNADRFIRRMIQRQEPLPWEEQASLLHAYRDNGDKRALQKLMGSYQRLIMKYAVRYLKRGMDFSDLVQEGNIGLLKAIDKFDFARGCQLSTMATWWVFNEITTAIKTKSKVMKEPSEKKFLQKEWNLLRIELGRSPTSKELAERVNMSEDDVINNIMFISDVFSLDEAALNLEGVSVADRIVDRGPASIEEMIEVAADAEQVNRWINQLSFEDADFVRKKFGMIDTDRTRKQMASVFQKSEDEIRKWDKRVMDQLRLIINRDLLNCGEEFKDADSPQA